MLYKIDTQQKFDPDLAHLELIVSNIRCGSIETTVMYLFQFAYIYKVREKGK